MQKNLEGLCNSELDEAQFLKILKISEVSRHKKMFPASAKTGCKLQVLVWAA